MNWRRFIKRTQADAELRQELESYIEITTEEYIAQGMGVAEAREAARRKLGNATRIREEVYEMNTATFVETTMQELRHSVRMLRRNPAFSLTAVLTLAIGIGANTAVFSVVNTVLLKPLPYPGAERLISVQHTAPGAAGLMSVSGDLRLSASMFFTYADHNRSFDAIGAWTAGTATVTGQGDPEEARVIGVTRVVREALGVKPGRAVAFRRGSGARRPTYRDVELWVLAAAVWRGRCGDRKEPHSGCATGADRRCDARRVWRRGYGSGTHLALSVQSRAAD